MMEFNVGKEFPLADCRGLSGFFFDYGAEGVATLTAAFPHILPEDVDMLSAGHGTIGLFMWQGVIFLSFKFGDLCGDFAYSVHMSKEPQKVVVAVPEKGTGLGLGIFAVDATDNILKGMHFCALGTRWTKTFGDMIEEQKLMPFDETKFVAKVMECQRRWSSEELLEMSPVKYKIGTKEGEDILDMFKK